MAITPLVEFIKSGGGTAFGLLAGAGFSAIGIVALVLGIIFLLAWLAVGIGGLVLWVWMFVDCLQRKFKRSNEKLVWIVVLVATIFGAGLLLHLVAALIYNFTVRKKAKVEIVRPRLIRSVPKLKVHKTSKKRKKKKRK